MRWMWMVLGVWATVGLAQTAPVPNPGFEEGGAQPVGWTLSQGQGAWVTENGSRVLSITGDGRNDNYWRSADIAFEPATTYRLRYRARRLQGEGGTPTTGPAWANRDLGTIPEAWTWYTQLFTTPRAVPRDQSWLRFGQWHLNGTIAFDDVSLVRAAPVYHAAGDLVLGEGEAVHGSEYVFQAPLGSGNPSRPLESHQAGFNSNRWVFGQGSELIYRHQIGERRQTAATAEVSIGYYVGGELVVEASRDCQTWLPVGTQSAMSTVKHAIPAALLPAPVVYVRLRAQARQRVGTESDPGSFQIHGYAYRASIDGEPAFATGSTRYVAVPSADERVEVAFESLGEGLPGADNTLVATIRNKTAAPLAIHPAAAAVPAGEPLPVEAGPAITLAPGSQRVRTAYRVPGPGAFDLVFTLGGGLGYRAETTITVSDLHRNDYGERLPASSEAVGLWWCDSGWKVSALRSPPTAAGSALRLAAAQNETEAAQVVVRPATALQGFRAVPGELKGPGGAVLPAARIEVLRVRYVNIERPTDATGAAGPWPDPLPPLTAPLDLPAGRNQPLWIRVNVPKATPPGEYTGAVRLSASGYQAEVPLRLRVYGFELPDRMTVTTAFGFSPNTAFQYQGLTTAEQRREVLAKYLANYSAHHISPYDPAPLDAFQVNWPQLQGEWQGGARDRAEKHAGATSLKLVDDSEKTTASAAYGQPITIPDGGVRFRFWYKTAAPNHPFIVTFNHHDADGRWMSGRNNDMRLVGNGQWQEFDRTITAFPPGAKRFQLTLRPVLWSEEGATTGTVWFDDLSLTSAAGEALVKGGDFEPLALGSLRPSIDWSQWDQAMTRAIDQYHFNSFRFPLQGLGGGTFHARVEPSLLGYPEGTPEYEAAFTHYVQQVEAHLAEKGWLDEAFIYWFDEPDPKDYEFVANGFRKLKEKAPGLRRMLTEQPEPELLGGPNIWCPISDAFNAETARPRMAAGETFWWYVCTGPKAPYATLFIDHPGTEMRVWLWQTWQRGIEGILVWASNYWSSGAAYPDAKNPQNPYEDPMSWVSGYDTPAGTKRPWGNGDGRFVYPPEAAADGRPAQPVLDGPVDSIRWEMLRDGIEDYENFVILKRLLAERGASLPAAERARFEALLEVPASITTTATAFTKDPAPLTARREEMLAAIEVLAKR